MCGCRRRVSVFVAGGVVAFVAARRWRFFCLLRVPLSPHGGDGSRVPRGAHVCRRASASRGDCAPPVWRASLVSGLTGPVMECYAIGVG